MLLRSRELAIPARGLELGVVMGLLCLCRTVEFEMFQGNKNKRGWPELLPFLTPYLPTIDREPSLGMCFKVEFIHDQIGWDTLLINYYNWHP